MTITPDLLPPSDTTEHERTDRVTEAAAPTATATATSTSEPSTRAGSRRQVGRLAVGALAISLIGATSILAVGAFGASRGTPSDDGSFETAERVRHGRILREVTASDSESGNPRATSDAGITWDLAEARRLQRLAPSPDDSNQRAEQQRHRALDPATTTDTSNQHAEQQRFVRLVRLAP